MTIQQAQALKIKAAEKAATSQFTSRPKTQAEIDEDARYAKISFEQIRRLVGSDVNMNSFKSLFGV